MFFLFPVCVDTEFIITHIVLNSKSFSRTMIEILPFSLSSEMKLHEPKPSGLMANPAFANVVHYLLIN